MQSPGCLRFTLLSLAVSALGCGAAVTGDPTEAALQGVQVEVQPKTIETPVGSKVSFAAAVTGTANLAVTWSVLEANGGTVSASGLYTAPQITGPFNIVATSVADPSKKGVATATVGQPSSTDISAILDASRRTIWNPGLNSVGGIPNRTTIFATLSPKGGTSDDTSAIQTALNGAAAIATKASPQVVKLNAGTFRISGDGLIVSSYVTLRGAGPTQTKVVRTDADTAVMANIIVGTRWGSDKFGTAVNLTSDAVKGATSVTVSSTSGLKVGDLIHVDELNDFSRVWLSEAANAWFSRLNRNVSQRMEIAAISGSVLTFTTPFHVPFRVSQSAQLLPLDASHQPVRWAGVEDLYTYGGMGGDGGGNFLIVNGMYCWLKNVEAERSQGAGAGFAGAYRSEIRDSFIHTANQPNPAASEYMFQLDWGSSDNLIENNIAWDCGKVIVFRASGGGNVVGYNYMDDAFISYSPDFVESGINASHQAAPHMELFEGNQSFNFDSDITHGNSFNIVAFRNHLTGRRRGAVTSFDLHDGTGSHAITLTDGFPRACIRTSAHDFWFSFVGNVCGTANQTLAPQTSWVFDASGASAGDGSIFKIWMLGNGGGNHWGDAADPAAVSTTVRHGNYDFFTKTTAWDPNIASRTLPNSLYLTSKPAFFGSNRWPWVTPENPSDPVGTLPARVRFDSTH